MIITNWPLKIVHCVYQYLRRRYRLLYKRRTNFVLKNIGMNQNVLILGARDSFVNRVIQYTNNKLNYFLVDKNEPTVKESRLVFKASDLNSKIPFPDNFFDCIIADQLIEHLEKPDSFLKEIKRVGKKDCTVIIGSENLAAWHNIMALILSFHPFSDHYSEAIRVGNPLSIHHKQKIVDPYMRHLKVPTIRGLKELMRYYGFEIVKIQGFGHILPLGVLFDKYHSIQFVILSKLKK